MASKSLEWFLYATTRFHGNHKLTSLKYNSNNNKNNNNNIKVSNIELNYENFQSGMELRAL